MSAVSLQGEVQYPVHYIPKISMHLISMGQFLNDSLSVKGDACHISLFDKVRPMLTCKPISFSQNIYWLDASVTDVQAKVSPALGQHLCWRPCKLCNWARVCIVFAYESGITPV
jgi:hypothetical protein